MNDLQKVFKKFVMQTAKITRLRAIGAAVVLMLSVTASAVSAGEPNEVVVIRGFGGHWLRADAFREKLEAQGFNPTVIWAYQRSSYSKSYIADIRAGKRTHPAAIVGYSLGATNAQTMAREFQSAGIEVPVLILLDGPALKEIPSNVGLCMHYYRPNFLEKVLPTEVVGNRLLSIEGKLRFAQRGMQLTPVDQQTNVYNVQVNNRGDLGGFSLLDSHTTLPGNEKVQETLVADVARYHARSIHTELGKLYEEYGPRDKRPESHDDVMMATALQDNSPENSMKASGPNERANNNNSQRDSKFNLRHAGFHFEPSDETLYR